MAEEVPLQNTDISEIMLDLNNPSDGRRSPSGLLLRLRDFLASKGCLLPTYVPHGFPPHNPPMMFRLLMANISHYREITLKSQLLFSNIYEINPQRLLYDLCRGGELRECLFFTLRGRKHENETKIHRAVGDGFWMLELGGRSPIITSSGACCGVRNNFAFYYGEEFSNDQPTIYMEEYRLSEDYYPGAVGNGWVYGDWVLCKMYEFGEREHPRILQDPLVISLLHSSFKPPSLCIPYLFDYYNKHPSPSTIQNLMTVEDALLFETGPPMVYLILIYAISNRGDQIKEHRFPVIPNMIMSNIYEINPDEFAVFHGNNPDKEWFCFTIRSREYENDTILNCAFGDGYWLLDRLSGTNITVEDGGSSIGVRRTFEFYSQRRPTGVKTCWIMHEFRLHEPISEKVGDWVLYKIWNNEKTDGSDSQIVEHQKKRKDIPTTSGETNQGNKKKEMIAMVTQAAA